MAKTKKKDNNRESRVMSCVLTRLVAEVYSIYLILFKYVCEVFLYEVGFSICGINFHCCLILN